MKKKIKILLSVSEETYSYLLHSRKLLTEIIKERCKSDEFFHCLRDTDSEKHCEDCNDARVHMDTDEYTFDVIREKIIDKIIDKVEKKAGKFYRKVDSFKSARDLFELEKSKLEKPEKEEK